MKIQDKALLANLTISTWTAKKFDKKATATVTTTHHTDGNAGRYNKSLVAKTRLDEITKIAGKARTYHYEHTLPYQTKGQSILATAVMMEYMAEFKKTKAEFNHAVNTFMNCYDIMREEAKFSLGDLYNEEDYPPAHKLEKKFNMDIDFSPIPEGSHLRIDIDAADLETMQADIEARVNDSVKTAMDELWKRLYDVTAAIKERLTPDADGSAKLFRDSLIKNAHDLVDLLPKLNIVGDPDLNQMADEIRRELATIDPQRLRKYNDVRRDTAATAARIMDKIEKRDPNTAPEPTPEPRPAEPTTPEIFTALTPDPLDEPEVIPAEIPTETPPAYQLPADLAAKLAAAGIL
jgi:hypothetical protein